MMSARIRTSILLSSISLMIAGCTFGPSSSIVEERMNPAGMRVLVYLLDEQRAVGGEMLSVTPDEIRVLTPVGIAPLPSSAVDRMYLDGSNRVIRVHGRPIEKKHLDDMKPLTRFPAGIPADVLERLYELHGRHDFVDGEEGAQAQHHGHDLAPVHDQAATAFVDQVREAIRDFSDRDNAIAAGYRQVGPDFPGMGEHWVHPRLIFKQDVNPLAPPVLSYVDVDGRAVLTGAAFAMPLMDGQEPPELPFGDVWHEHEGTVDEETLVLNPGVRIHGTGSETRLAMFHVWTDLENPEGPFTQDNWSLPFVRLGLSVPAHPTPDAAKALFLLSNGDDYYLRLIEVASDPGQTEFKRFERILTAAAENVRSTISAADEGLPEMAPLAEIWSGAVRELREAASPDTWSRLGPIFAEVK